MRHKLSPRETTVVSTFGTTTVVVRSAGSAAETGGDPVSATTAGRGAAGRSAWVGLFSVASDEPAGRGNAGRSAPADLFSATSEAAATGPALSGPWAEPSGREAGVGRVPDAVANVDVGALKGTSVRAWMLPDTSTFSRRMR